MGTTILSFEDRIVIETLHYENRSLRYIADCLGFNKTTVFNEIHRLTGEYHIVKTQADHEAKLSHRGRKAILTTNLRWLAEEKKIKIQRWSIEQVAHVVRIAYKTIYNWIDQGVLNIGMADLLDHGIRRRRAKETRGAFSHGHSIEDRPAEVIDRHTSSRFKADTVLSGKCKGQAIVTLVERKSRLIVVKRLQGRDSTSVTKAILESANQLEDDLEILIVDHEKEFASYKLIKEQARIPLYFAHAYSPHEQGSNENHDRVLQRFIPKSQPIEEVTDDELI